MTTSNNEALNSVTPVSTATDADAVADTTTEDVSSEDIPDSPILEQQPTKDDDDDDDEEGKEEEEDKESALDVKVDGDGDADSKPKLALRLALPSIAQVVAKVALGTVVALYVLNQNHLLPKGLSSIVSKTLFYPTLPITMSRRIGKWTTVVDDNVVMGGAPFGWLNKPEKLNKDYGVTGVINMCEEYKGPCKKYDKLGMKELHLPTTDHFEPSFEDMQTAVEFIQKYSEEDLGKVYVHCRAGHGRSAAIVYAYLLSKENDLEQMDMKAINEQLCAKRNVRKTLYKQPNVNQFRDWLRVVGRHKEKKDNDDDDDGGNNDVEE